jgi:hypothetical protein
MEVHDMILTKKGGETRLVTKEVARWLHHNVNTFVHAEIAMEEVTWFSVEQCRTFSTIKGAGEAQSFEASDLTPAMTGLALAKKCIRYTSRWCRRCESWPYGFRPSDLVVIDPDEDHTHPNLVDHHEDGWMRTLVFENKTPSDLSVFKVSQFRIVPWGYGFGRSKFLEFDDLDDAMNGLAKARAFLKRRERELWFDDTCEVLK